MMSRIPTPRKERLLTVLICAAGIGAVFYGMEKRRHPVFIVGLVLVIIGYLVIRKRLKEHLRKKE